jgi:hypothetical protein
MENHSGRNFIEERETTGGCGFKPAGCETGESQGFHDREVRVFGFPDSAGKQRCLRAKSGVIPGIMADDQAWVKNSA